MSTNPTKPAASHNGTRAGQPDQLVPAGPLSMDDAEALAQVEARLLAKQTEQARQAGQDVVAAGATDPQVAAVAVGAAKLARAALTSFEPPPRRSRKPGDRKAG